MKYALAFNAYSERIPGISNLHSKADTIINEFSDKLLRCCYHFLLHNIT